MMLYTVYKSNYQTYEILKNHLIASSLYCISKKQSSFIISRVIKCISQPVCYYYVLMLYWLSYTVAKLYSELS